MNRLVAKLIDSFVVVVFAVVSPCALASGSATVLTNLVVTSNAMPSLTGWTIGGSELSVQPTTPPPVSGDAPYALEAQYPAVGPNGIAGPWADFDVSSLNTESIYIDFWAKMPDAKGGFKFCKIFGIGNDPTGYANTTIATDYTGVDNGSIRQISFGDGSSTTNDTQNVINLDATYPQWIGRSYGQAVVLTPQMQTWASSNWGTGWHHFRIHIKFNTVSPTTGEKPDGEYYLEIDGKVYADATGLYNRNPGNGPINFIGFFG